MLEQILKKEVRECDVVWRGLRMALMRTHGILLYTTRPRYQREIEPFRDLCREWQPISSKYNRFDAPGNNPEDWRSLLRIALRGDVVDVGATSSGAFDALYALLAMGVPSTLLGSESFLAGVIHLQPIRRITDRSAAIPLAESGDADLIERVNIALNGASDAVCLRGASDAGELFPYVEVYLPHPQLCSEVQRGKMQEAGEQWALICREYEPRQVRDQALQAVIQGRMDPRDYELELGPIQWQSAIRDRVVQGYEM